MIKSQIRFVKTLPSVREFSSSTILFYDRKVLRHPFLKKWISGFKYKIALNAGESLKTLNSYSAALQQIQKMTLKNQIGGRDLTFIALGGGSIGDFVGFLASTYQRGKKLIFVPTTWLAAIDSAHGGKNGLNLNSVKNQIGTFYPAEMIIICEKVLKTLPPESLNDAFSEALKMGIINRPQVFLNIQKNSDSLMRHLPRLIEGKYEIVNHDPLEKKGLRKVLNLGHTVGHVFESVHKLPHGQAVFLGILFSFRFSLKRKYLSWNEFQFLIDKLFLIETEITYQQALNIPVQKVRAALMQDKKKVSQKAVDFIFVKKIGKVFIKSISMDEIIKEFSRQQQEL